MQTFYPFGSGLSLRLEHLCLGFLLSDYRHHVNFRRSSDCSSIYLMAAGLHSVSNRAWRLHFFLKVVIIFSKLRRVDRIWTFYVWFYCNVQMEKWISTWNKCLRLAHGMLLETGSRLKLKLCWWYTYDNKGCNGTIFHHYKYLGQISCTVPPRRLNALSKWSEPWHISDILFEQNITDNSWLLCQLWYTKSCRLRACLYRA